jgi:lipopolysaccharide export system protein LptC
MCYKVLVDSAPGFVGGGRLSYSSTISMPAPRVGREIGPRDAERLFRAAARHSRFVRWMRRAIPAAIVVVAAVIVIATFFNPFRLIGVFPIDIGKVSLSGTKITMEAPRLAGFTSDARPYELTARAAAQDLTKPEVLELKGINAKVELNDGQRVQIKAINGLFDTKSEILKLRDEIVLTTTTGYEGRLSEATVETGTGHIVSDSPVEMKLLNGGRLNANHLEIVDNGASIQFSGGVELLLNQETQSSDLSGGSKR